MITGFKMCEINILKAKTPRHNSQIWCQNDRRNKHTIVTEYKKEVETKFFGLKKRNVAILKSYCDKCSYNEKKSKFNNRWKWKWQ